MPIQSWSYFLSNLTYTCFIERFLWNVETILTSRFYYSYLFNCDIPHLREVYLTSIRNQTTFRVLIVTIRWLNETHYPRKCSYEWTTIVSRTYVLQWIKDEKIQLPTMYEYTVGTDFLLCIILKPEISYVHICDPSTWKKTRDEKFLAPLRSSRRPRSQNIVS